MCQPARSEMQTDEHVLRRLSMHRVWKVKSSGMSGSTTVSSATARYRRGLKVARESRAGEIATSQANLTSTCVTKLTQVRLGHLTHSPWTRTNEDENVTALDQPH
ncbi:MAG: hypothetical protein CMM01_21745 [Rhodopirellula sp.]|nr:hypothetical protein [Rhodopirellula sp.]